MATAPKESKSDFISFEKNASRIDAHQYWKSLRVAYDSEPHTVHHRERLERLFRADRPGRDLFMNAEERNALAQLPNGLTVYRGYGDLLYGDGIAWTLHKPAAIWYANRYEPTRSHATIRVGRLLKSWAYAYRNGGDILVDPRLVNLKWVEWVSHIKEAQGAWDDYVPEFDLAAYLKMVG